MRNGKRGKKREQKETREREIPTRQEKDVHATEKGNEREREKERGNRFNDV